MQVLGLELLSTNQPSSQPVQWFSAASSTPIVLQARLIAPYRYLDVTDLLQQAGVQWAIAGDALAITFPPAQIASIRHSEQPWGKRLVLDLDRPTFWQVTQAKAEGVVTIEGTASPQLLAQFQHSPAAASNEQASNSDEDDLGSGAAAVPSQLAAQWFALDSSGAIGSASAQTAIAKLKIKLPTAQGLRVFSLANPNRLAIDIRPDALTPREIQWAPGVTWRQQFVSLRNGLRQSLFPVHSLEVDLRSPHLSLKPMTSNPSGLEGIAPLVATARSQQAIAAINGGFFNRNNKLPLGAIRQDSRWLSGPILNRGAIAWNERGEIKIGRLSLRESLITATGNRLPILFLNSGYLQAGMARYTPEWGTSYTPLTDSETIIRVENNQVTQQFKAGKSPIAIPSNGYLLTIRNNGVSAAALIPGTQLTLENTTLPADFDRYSQILGAGPLLLQGGRLVLNGAGEQFSKAFTQQTASRSAIATTPRGTLMIVAVHNRVGGRGATLAELAQILQQLGAVDALNLDGGSSTSLYLGGQLIDRSPVTAARVHNGLGIFLAP
jgi:hypothetical protein